MTSTTRSNDDAVHGYVSPYVELNAGLWSLFAGASVALGLRVWCKVTRRHGLWYDDFILIFSWAILLANNSLIIHQFRTGYQLKDTTEKWDDRMHILINISSCGTLVGQALTKTAFGVTLLRLSNRWQKGVIWFCIFTMNLYMVLKILFQWAKVCGKSSYQNWYRLDFCIDSTFRDDFKEGGNVYNIIMDFVFAAFPWWITRSLEMRRVEKIGLCVTMSLGMLVAIVSAIRISWKDDGNERDEYYIWRNGLSQVWYSSEITGTIIVQCIPLLRPILREFHTSLTSKRLSSSTDAQHATWGSKFSGKRASAGANNDLAVKGAERIVLREIPEDPEESADWKTPRVSLSPSDGDQTIHASSVSDSWPLSGNEGQEIRGSQSGKSFDIERNGRSPSITGATRDHDEEKGLSPPPRRPAQQ